MVCEGDCVSCATAAAWLSAIGTVGALFTGMVVFAREQRDRRRGQARQVNAWAVDVLPEREQTERGLVVGMEGDCVLVRALNTSPEPVYEFHVWVHHNLAPDSGRIGSLDRSILPPGSHEIYVDGVQIPDGGLADMPHVDVTFRDTAGRRWQRLYTGRFSRDRISREGMDELLRYRLRSLWRRLVLRLGSKSSS
jgi:hypothetical protein